MADNNVDDASNNKGAMRFLGGGSGRTVIQLVIASIIVGAIFSFLGVGVLDFWRGIFDAVHNLISSIGESLGEIVVNLLTYLVIGAAVVIPIWLISRLISGRK